MCFSTCFQKAIPYYAAAGQPITNFRPLAAGTEKYAEKPMTCSSAWQRLTKSFFWSAACGCLQVGGLGSRLFTGFCKQLYNILSCCAKHCTATQHVLHNISITALPDCMDSKHRQV